MENHYLGIDIGTYCWNSAVVVAAYGKNCVWRRSGAN